MTKAFVSNEQVESLIEHFQKIYGTPPRSRTP